MTIRVLNEQEAPEQALTKMSAAAFDDTSQTEASVQPFDPKRKLSHQELFALPIEQQMQYFDAHGGVFAVMGEMGCALTEEDIEDWHRFKAERRAKLAQLSPEEAWKLIYGEE